MKVMALLMLLSSGSAAALLVRRNLPPGRLIKIN